MLIESCCRFPVVDGWWLIAVTHVWLRWIISDHEIVVPLVQSRECVPVCVSRLLRHQFSPDSFVVIVKHRLHFLLFLGPLVVPEDFLIIKLLIAVDIGCVDLLLLDPSDFCVLEKSLKDLVLWFHARDLSFQLSLDLLDLLFLFLGLYSPLRQSLVI